MIFSWTYITQDQVGTNGANKNIEAIVFEN
jgi:hypothetical protein